MTSIGDRHPKARPRLATWATGSLGGKAREKVEAHLEVSVSDRGSQTLPRNLSHLSAQSKPGAPEPPGGPISRPDANFLGKVAGTGLSVVGSLLGATGAILVGQIVQLGPVPLAELLGQQGVLQSLTTVARIDQSTALWAALSSCSAGLGGFVVGTKLPDLLSARPGASAAAAGVGRPHQAGAVEVRSKAMGALTGLCTLPAAVTGGFLGGHLLAQAVSVSSPVALGAAVAGAAVVGGLSLVGGLNLGKDLFS